jgi:hypothetical protein
MAQSSFETSKQQFIGTVREAYEKFLIDNGVDLEHLLEDIRNRSKKQQEKRRLEMLEIASNKLFYIEARFNDRIQEYYGDLVDVEIISEWYYNDSCIIMEFMWNSKSLWIMNIDGKLKIRGGSKKLRLFIKSDTDLKKDFIDESNNYYQLSENYYTAEAKYSE